LLTEKVYLNVIRTLCGKYGISIELARECVHSSIANTNMNTLNNINNPSGYLYVAAKHHLFNWDNKKPLLFVDPETIYRVPEPESEIEEEFHDIDFESISRKLTTIQNRLYRLICEGYTLKEIAEIENLAYNSVAARRRKLINRIRNLSPDEKEQASSNYRHLL
jgi:DNA-directed RNA polymerase specialized sigma24 family protein